ncbi:MAG: metalloregulator ArsR/SmtB family transcription factor [bacterium]|nr:metalloregulator ArsR/SmtB family transcription factor [bacterium]
MYERLFQLQEETLKTLANQKRLEIVQLLINKELTVSEMVTMLGMPQSNLSQHLGILRRYKIVKTRKDGLHVYYRLTDERVARVIAELREFLKSQYTNEPEVMRLGSLNKSSVYPIAKDPVCGMRLSTHEAFDSLEHSGETYFFCASGCREKFSKHPGRHIKKETVSGTRT